MRPWRLLDTGRADGLTNMAVDEAILEAYRRSGGRPTLRFYRWEGPTLSLGYGQGWSEADAERCRREGVAVVRRPSGGRAVLHDGEITYSVAGSAEDGLGDSIRSTYCLLTGALAAGLATLGVDAVMGRSKAEGWHGAACFQVGTGADLMWRGRKLAGSAQCRRGAAFLQHGSILIDQDLQRLGRLLDAPLVGMSAVTLAEILQPVPTWERLKEAICAGFAVHLGADLQPSELTADEQAICSARLQVQVAWP